MQMWVLRTSDTGVMEINTVYIDADGCPVVRLATDIAIRHGFEVVLVCDTSHIM